MLVALFILLHLCVMIHTSMPLSLRDTIVSQVRRGNLHCQFLSYFVFVFPSIISSSLYTRRSSGLVGNLHTC